MGRGPVSARGVRFKSRHLAVTIRKRGIRRLDDLGRGVSVRFALGRARGAGRGARVEFVR